MGIMRGWELLHRTLGPEERFAIAKEAFVTLMENEKLPSGARLVRTVNEADEIRFTNPSTKESFVSLSKASEQDKEDKVLFFTQNLSDAKELFEEFMSRLQTARFTSKRWP